MLKRVWAPRAPTETEAECNNSNVSCKRLKGLVDWKQHDTIRIMLFLIPDHLLINFIYRSFVVFIAAESYNTFIFPFFSTVPYPQVNWRIISLKLKIKYFDVVDMFMNVRHEVALAMIVLKCNIIIAIIQCKRFTMITIIKTCLFMARLWISILILMVDKVQVIIVVIINIIMLCVCIYLL